jgi:hypothetical protein
MNLRSLARRGSGITAKALSPTTTPGHTNPNGQIVITATGAPSPLRNRQSIYHLRCTHCRYNYGCNGMDIKDRRCPNCQSGTPGEPLRDPAPTLDFGP